MTELSPLQDKIYIVLKSRANTDVSISELYIIAYGFGAQRGKFRDMQQKLGPIFARINEKLEGQRVEPGELKRTYRLNTKTPV